MPIYEYKCSHCGHQLEAIQKISDDPLLLCPNCDKNGLKKQVTAPSFRLKGSGWYETDFKTGKKKNLSDDSSKKESVNTVTDSKKADKKDKIS
ncbi:MAG: FmdB family zinc ribbon protein [Gammaproteobacteria bacterium]|jgi:putative FmdB family regulatory protein|nr:FmdB family transcriptional regulator [Gammaproteobacteria bacterium]|tara:strand:+ start:42 stop:320 length:279 start_codon:yes stop_codon:yes gene_type:complete